MPGLWHNRGAMRKSGRINKEQALSFLLTHIVVEKQCPLELTPQSLFALMTLAGEAEERVNQEEGIIAHEVIEELATGFIDSR